MFDEEGCSKRLICDTFRLNSQDFINPYTEKEKNVWDYSKLDPNRVIKKISLNKVEQEKYDKSTLKDNLRNANEKLAYEYLIWSNPNNIQLIKDII